MATAVPIGALTTAPAVSVWRKGHSSGCKLRLEASSGDSNTLSCRALISVLSLSSPGVEGRDAAQAELRIA